MTFWDTVAKITLGVGAIMLIAGYWNFARPVFHSTNFEAGTCNFSRLTVDKNDKSCSCGKSCTGYYPCFTLTGFYFVNKTANTTQTDFNGTFYKDYVALKAKCLVVPSCNRKESTNAEAVYKFFNTWIRPYANNHLYPGENGTENVINYTNSTLVPCYGKDHQMYFEMKYAMWKAIVSLAVPGGAFLIGLLITVTCSSSEHKSQVWTILGFPFLVILAVLEVIDEIFSISSCFRRCCRNCRESRQTSARPTVATPRHSITRRHSIELHHRSDIGSTNSMEYDRRHSSSSISSAVRRVFSFNLDPNQPSTVTVPDYPDSRRNSGPTYGAANFDPPPVYDGTGGDGPAPPPSYNDVMYGNAWRDEPSRTSPTPNAPSYI